MTTPTVTLLLAMLAVVAEASVFVALVVVGGARWSSRLAGCRDGLADSCTPIALEDGCQAEVPRMVDWLAGGAPDGVRLVAVSTGVDAARPNYPPSAWLERVRAARG